MQFLQWQEIGAQWTRTDMVQCPPYCVHVKMQQQTGVRNSALDNARCTLQSNKREKPSSIGVAV